MLRAVLQETDDTKFQSYLNQLLEDLPSLHESFSSYFLKEWAGNTEMWAYRYRKGMGINTNMVLEAFHRALKYNYLKGKVNKRVDNCLVNLLKYARDKSFARFIKLTRGGSCSKTNIINDRHSKSLRLNANSVHEIEEGRWQVKSEDGKNSYIVIKQCENCSDASCQLRCNRCNICVHMYSCTCPDSLIQNTICKHVHLLNLKVIKTTENEQPPLLNTDKTDYVNNELKLICEHMPLTEERSDVNVIKERIQAHLLELGTAVQSCIDKEALLQLDKKLLTAAKSLLVAMQQYQKPMSLQPKQNIPANKNIDPQRRFFSTKKKRKFANKGRFTKPTTEDLERIFSKDNWKCSTCGISECKNMIMCDTCSTWHHW